MNVELPVHNVSPEELRQAHLTATQAREIALRNLQSAITSGTIVAKVFDAGPEGRPFILTDSTRRCNILATA